MCVGRCDGLLVCHLGSSLVAFNIELSLKTVNKNFKMQLTHAADDCLSAVRIGLHPEGGILLGKLTECVAQTVNVSLCLRFDGDPDNRFRELH